MQMDWHIPRLPVPQLMTRESLLRSALSTVKAWIPVFPTVWLHPTVILIVPTAVLPAKSPTISSNTILTAILRPLPDSSLTPQPNQGATVS